MRNKVIGYSLIATGFLYAILTVWNQAPWLFALFEQTEKPGNHAQTVMFHLQSIIYAIGLGLLGVLFGMTMLKKETQMLKWPLVIMAAITAAFFVVYQIFAIVRAYQINDPYIMKSFQTLDSILFNFLCILFLIFGAWLATKSIQEDDNV